MVCKLDRFARTAGDGSTVIKELMARGVKVHILNMGLIEDTPTGKLIMNILLSFAEFERDNIVERLSEGREIAKLKNADYREGRKPKEIPAEYYDLNEKVVAGVMSVTAACAELGIGRTTWYKWARG
jgi:DNA invertase Pin-like site-specific DNA recombinase